MDEEFDPEAYASGDVTTSEPTKFDPAQYSGYKQALAQKILSGATDYTYGPGSPVATSSDMRQKTGARDNALQTGDVALPEKDYNLFTPQERTQLGIADTSWIKEGQPTPRGSVERYFGTDAQGFDPKAYGDGKPQPQPIPTPTAVPDIKAFLEPAPTEPEAAPSASTEATPSIGEAIGSGIKGAAQAIGRSTGAIPQFQAPQRQPFVIPQQMQQAPLIGQTPPPIPVPQPTPDMSQQFPLMQQLLPQPQTMPTPQFQPTQPAPVMQGTMQGLQQTVAGMIPHTMEQFQGLAQILGAPTDPQSFFNAALRQGLVTSQIAQAAIKAGPLSKEAGLAYGTILPQVLMAAGGLSEAGAIPSAGTIARSLTGQNLLPRARESGAIGATGGGKRTYQTPSGEVTIQGGDVPVPESWQPKVNTVEQVPGSGAPEPGTTTQSTPPAQGSSGTVPWNGQGTPPPPAPPVAPPPPSGGVPPQPPKTPMEVLRNRQIVDRITSGHDSVFTRADYDARQKVNPLRQEFGAEVTKSAKSDKNVQAQKDLEAATFIAEAQGNKVALKQDRDLIRSAKNKKLASKYGAIAQYALDNFDRISKIQNRYGKLMTDQLAEDKASGITYGEREGYVTHVLKSEPPSSLISFFTDKMGAGGLSRYFTKNREFDTLAQAINAGVEPASVNLADLAQHRIAASRRLILQKALFNDLKNIAGKDGNPVVKGIFRMPEPPHPPVIPQGYDLLNANGVEIASHPDYSGIFKALYGDSALRRTATGRTIMRGAGISKAYTLGADTYHGFRGIQKGLFYGGKGSRLGYSKGTTVYELSNEALDHAVNNGEISRTQADWAKSARPAVEEMMKNGLNVSRYADNLVGQLHVQFPGTRGLNNWIFNRVFRGSMIQASHANYLRNLSRWPELSKMEVARKTSKEMNEVFGNLMNQGLFRDKTVRDSLNVAFLAPQWIESQARAEFRGYGQGAKIIPDALRGKFRVGTVAQGQATAVAAYLLGNQIINYATTGHSTFENDGGHKLSAFLPVGDRGVYLDPLALSAEYVDRFMQILDRQGEHASIPGVVSEMARSKLSRAGQALVTLATQRDWAGKHLEGGDLYKQAASDFVPLPIAAKNVGQVFSLDPNSSIGVSVEPQFDKITQGVLQAMGQRGVLGPAAASGQYPRAPLRVRRPRPINTRRTSKGVI